MFIDPNALPRLAQETQRMLALNIMYKGFITDPDKPGSEKLVVASINDKWLKEPRMRIASMELGAGKNLLDPQSTFAVKGWNRSVAVLLVVKAACELGDELIKAWGLLGHFTRSCQNSLV